MSILSHRLFDVLCLFCSHIWYTHTHTHFKCSEIGFLLVYGSKLVFCIGFRGLIDHSSFISFDSGDACCYTYLCPSDSWFAGSGFCRRANSSQSKWLFPLCFACALFRSHLKSLRPVLRWTLALLNLFHLILLTIYLYLIRLKSAIEFN